MQEWQRCATYLRKISQRKSEAQMGTIVEKCSLLISQWHYPFNWQMQLFLELPQRGVRLFCICYANQMYKHWQTSTSTYFMLYSLSMILYLVYRHFYSKESVCKDQFPRRPSLHPGWITQTEFVNISDKIKVNQSPSVDGFNSWCAKLNKSRDTSY